MAITAPPQITKKQLTDKQIDQIVNKPIETEKAPDYIDDDHKVQKFTFRTNKITMKRIEKKRKERPRKAGSPKIGISINEWIQEAIEEKLKREKG